jgi:hypothetical protein
MSVHSFRYYKFYVKFITYSGTSSETKKYSSYRNFEF